MSDFSPRQLAPGPSPPQPGGELPLQESAPGNGLRHPIDPTKKRVSMACLACKKSKRKVPSPIRCGGVGGGPSIDENSNPSAREPPPATTVAPSTGDVSSTKRWTSAGASPPNGPPTSSATTATFSTTCSR
ncbi:hypothetical protein BDV59DRAFT_167803 [Aspergillus ambiguus]|uniref:uncharacterized protein n=1 Tax=Aspergillus ambiguus TaxID=176160 RepID=UPI003CCDD023